MPRVQQPGLKPTHKLVQAYYAALAQFDQHHVTRETAVRQPFLDLLRTAAGQRGWSLEPEFPMQGNRGHRIVVDAALRDAFWRIHGYWEAKDTDDDLEAEVRRKFDQGYPDSNILFQTPNRALLFQNGQPAFAADFTDPKNLVQVVNQFFAYTQPIHQKWDEAVADFQQQVPDLGRGLKQIIDAERKANPAFVAAFTDFAALCRASLNPNLRDEAVEEMLIQHLLTERLLRTVFKNPDFVRRNAIARQIETVLDALFSRSYTRDEYLGSLERFYRAIEDTAATITDFSTKQKFLNTVYEKFFQGFCVKVADTHGIVYTPPPIVRFMVASVEWLLKTHFGKSLASPNVHILDPFGGTGNFTVHTMQAIPKTALAHKFGHELWTNEIMLLPYYVGCMNIEHAFFEATGQYQPFPGACLVDTFETAETSINFFVRRTGGHRPGRIFYARTDEFWRKEQKYHFLNTHEDLSKIEWQPVHPDKDSNWLTEGMSEVFGSFLLLGTKLAKQADAKAEGVIFRNYSLGIATNRDSWVTSFSLPVLQARVSCFMEVYQSTLDRVRRTQPKTAEEVIDTADARIKWTRQVKAALLRHQQTSVEAPHFRVALYRPFTKHHLYFDEFWNEERYQQHKFFPTPQVENRVISMTSIGSEKPFMSLATDYLCDLHLTGPGTGAQCFPFYTYAEDGSDRRENITDWAMEHFRRRYPSSPLTKWDIFYYVYAILHHPQYRELYAANLRRQLPRIPLVPEFRAFAAAGKQLADLHIGYEQAKEYPLTRREKPDAQLNWRVEKMKLTRDKTALVYNDFLTLEGIPPETYEYRLGNRSALEWVIDQYQVSTDKRSGITNDPNRPDDPQYIVRLIAQVITVSLETVKIVKSLPPLQTD